MRKEELKSGENKNASLTKERVFVVFSSGIFRRLGRRDDEQKKRTFN